LLLIEPDFVLIVVLYWCIYQPRMLGIGFAWLIGLLMDVAHANIFGQYPMAYAAAVFLAIIFQRRILRFTGWQQALHIFILLLCSQLVIIAIRLFSGAAVNWWFLFGSVTGALLWPLISTGLQLWQRRKITQGRL
jgi:rod shape-determining protein MreD